MMMDVELDINFSSRGLWFNKKMLSDCDINFKGGCGGFIKVFLLCCGIYEMCLYYVLTILPSVLSIFDV